MSGSCSELPPLPDVQTFLASFLWSEIFAAGDPALDEDELCDNIARLPSFCLDVIPTTPYAGDLTSYLYGFGVDEHWAGRFKPFASIRMTKERLEECLTTEIAEGTLLTVSEVLLRHVMSTLKPFLETAKEEMERERPPWLPERFWALGRLRGMPDETTSKPVYTAWSQGVREALDGLASNPYGFYKAAETLLAMSEHGTVSITCLDHLILGDESHPDCPWHCEGRRRSAGVLAEDSDRRPSVSQSCGSAKAFLARLELVTDCEEAKSPAACCMASMREDETEEAEEFATSGFRSPGRTTAHKTAASIHEPGSSDDESDCAEEEHGDNLARATTDLRTEGAAAFESRCGEGEWLLV